MITRQVDRWVLHKKERWGFLCFLLLIFVLRMLYLGGYFAVAYLLGFTYLSNIILFITPQDVPSIEEEEEEEIYDIPEHQIPTNHSSDNSKPVIRKLHEFILW